MKYKTIKCIFLIFVSMINAQSYVSVKVVEKENQKPIANAKIICNNELLFTNDDGDVSVPSFAEEVKVSMSSFEEKIVKLPISKIELSPKYRNIDSLTIRSIDAKKIIENVFKNYNKNYLIDATKYKGVYSTKSYLDDKIQEILIANINLWTLNNKFDYKKKYDDFIQLSLNQIKYNKSLLNKSDYPYSIKGQESKEDFDALLKRFFLYNELNIMLYIANGLKINGKIINEKDDIQEILFKSDFSEKEGVVFEGTFLYNKVKNLITYLKVDQSQTKTIRKFRNNFDEELIFNTKKFAVEYDMIEENAKYLPARISMFFTGEITYKNKTLPVFQIKQYTFNSHEKTKVKGLENKLDFNKKLSENYATNEEIATKTLLSVEEQKFVDGQ